jgi:hypothetical protein
MAWMLEDCLADVYTLGVFDSIGFDGLKGVEEAMMSRFVSFDAKAEGKTNIKKRKLQKGIVTNQSELRKWWMGSFLPPFN